MSRKHSFVLTLSNNATEKEGVNYLIENHTGFFKIDLVTKKELLDLMNMSHKFLQAFDLIYIPEMASKVADTNFIGTLNNKPLVFKVNGIGAGKIDDSLYSVLLGTRAGLNLTGSYNTIIGDSAVIVALGQVRIAPAVERAMRAAVLTLWVEFDRLAQIGDSAIVITS